MFPRGCYSAVFGNKRTMLIGLICLGVGTLGLFWAGSIWQVFALRLLSGVWQGDVWRGASCVCGGAGAAVESG